MLPQLLSLHAPCLRVARPTWLFARTCDVFNRTALIIYKSTWLPDDDPWLDQLWEFIKDQDLRLHHRGVFADVELVFKEGEVSIYLQRGGSKDEGQDEIPGLLREAIAFAKAS